MALNKKTPLGEITITNQAIACVVANAAMECYGVVGLTTKNAIHEAIFDILKKNNFSKGAIVENDSKGISIYVYLVIAYDVKITEVLREVQKKVKYVVQKQFGVKVISVDVFAQSLKR